MPFSLAYSQSHLRSPPARDPHTQLARTENHWREWSARGTLEGRWREPIRRSLITLKALAYEPTGGIVAAPTTSLPGTARRHAQLGLSLLLAARRHITLLAMMRGGYYDEAARVARVAGPRVAGSPEQLQIMYGIAGERRLPEFDSTGCRATRARSRCASAMTRSSQLQLDVYGEVMNALHLARVGGLQATKPPGRAVRDARAPRNDLAGTRRRHLGNARRPRSTSRSRR